MRNEIIAEQRTTIVQAMDLLDREMILVAPPMGQRRESDYSKIMNELRQGFSRFEYERQKSFQALLEKERIDGLTVESARAREAQMSWRSSCGIVAFRGTIPPPRSHESVPSHRTDALLASPIARDLFDDLAPLLGLTGDALDAATAVFNDYASLMEEELKKPREESFEYWTQVRMRTEPAADPLARANKAREFHARVRAMVDAADAALLEQMRTIAGVPEDDAAWQRAHRAWLRACASIDIWWRGRNDPNQICSIDFVRLLAREPLDASTWQAIEQPMSEYEECLLNGHQRIRAGYAQFTYGELARQDGWRGDGNGSGLNWIDQVEAVHAINHELAQASHRQVTAILAALPPEVAARAWIAYTRAAFPPAYDDAGDMGPPLDRALALAELTVDQRSRIAEARMNFATVHDENRRAIVELCAAYLPDVPGIGHRGTEMKTRRDQAFEDGMQRLRDQRSAINREALRALRTTLSPAQLRQVSIPDVN